VKGGTLRPEGKIGIYSTDEEAYKAFGDLFGPIIKDLHPKFDFRYSYKAEDLVLDNYNQQLTLLKEYEDRFRNFKISVKRNFKGTPFAPLMTKESKLQVERKVVEVLGELYGQYVQVSRLEDVDKEWLEMNGVPCD